MNGSTNQAEDSKDQVAVCLHQSLDRVTGSDLSELQHSPNTNSNSHNAELHDVALPAAFFTAPGTSRLNPRHIPSGGATKDAGHHDTAALSQLECQQRTEALEQQQQMKILEWENRMKVLAWEQELVGDKRRAARQKEKAFRMKKAYYKAKLRKLGEDVPPSSSSDEDEKTSAATG